MINCVIIDDEPLAIQLLADFAEKTPYLRVAGKFEDPLQALTVLEAEKIDLLFLDIKMPDISGIDFYRSLPYKPEVIFTTAYSEYAIHGFELKAMDYLLKPVSFEKFITGCNRVKDYILSKQLKEKKNDKDHFFINAAHKMYKVFYNDIIYLEGYKDYTKIHLEGQSSPLLVLHNLKYFEDILPAARYTRIHRSYIVNLEKLQTISRKFISIGNLQLPVSDFYREAVFVAIGAEKTM